MMRGEDIMVPRSGETMVSIIIATFNASKTLQNCLNSIYAQVFPAIEIIVIDGNSADGTLDILQKNTRYISFWKSEPDHGIYDALNKGVEHVNGNWVYFLGADDELLPEFSDLVTQLKDTSVVYYANVFANGAKRVGKLNSYQFAKFGPYHQAMIYPRAVFEKYRFDTRYKISADFALTLKLCGDKAFHFIYKDYTIANFNHAGISGTRVDMPFQKDKAGLILENFGLKTWIRYMIRRFKSKNNPRA